ncbi:hypothetical protein BDB01DRAFT_253937 [Pilobolus umbonatus]|nr:hypothetical protein BDB01DRAFT_253937 [Pilobolus umbonatus]
MLLIIISNTHNKHLNNRHIINSIISSIILLLLSKLLLGLILLQASLLLNHNNSRYITMITRNTLLITPQKHMRLSLIIILDLLTTRIIPHPPLLLTYLLHRQINHHLQHIIQYRIALNRLFKQRALIITNLLLSRYPTKIGTIPHGRLI